MYEWARADRHLNRQIGQWVKLCSEIWQLDVEGHAQGLKGGATVLHVFQVRGGRQMQQVSDYSKSAYMVIGVIQPVTPLLKFLHEVK